MRIEWSDDDIAAVIQAMDPPHKGWDHWSECGPGEAEEDAREALNAAAPIILRGILKGVLGPRSGQTTWPTVRLHLRALADELDRPGG